MWYVGTISNKKVLDVKRLELIKNNTKERKIGE